MRMGDWSSDVCSSDLSDAESADAASEDKGEVPSMLDLTGESQTIKVTDTTTYEKEAQPEKPEEAPAADEAQKADDSKDADSTDEKSDDTEKTDDAEAADENAEATDDSADKDDAKAPEMKTEAIAFSDLKAGDTIKVTLDKDGNAAAVVVISADAPEADRKSVV